MSKRVISINVIIDGAQPDEAFLIQYAVGQVLEEVQDCLNASIVKGEK